MLLVVFIAVHLIGYAVALVIAVAEISSIDM